MASQVRILISGIVQGVFFRREIVDLAKRLGIAGWVKNLPDGRVEALAEGDRERLQALIEFCHVGPRGALVRNVQVEWLDFSGELHGFRIVKSPHTSQLLR